MGRHKEFRTIVISLKYTDLFDYKICIYIYGRKIYEEFFYSQQSVKSKKSYKDIDIMRRVKTYLDFQNYIELPLYRYLLTHSRNAI